MGRFSQWLEHHWVSPAYGGWVLLGLALFFFAAATNTLAGWLYVISGVLLALLGVAAVLPPRYLNGLEVQRQPIPPVSAGEPLEIELRVTNTQGQPKGLFQIIDRVPPSLGRVQPKSVGTIAPGQVYGWHYLLPTNRRGLYHWQGVDLRSAAPLGLFWCSRQTLAPASAIVYPKIFPLQRCAVLDTAGLGQSQQIHFKAAAQSASDGLTRALRPYRWGDPTRLIHWRTSARYGELRVRELEQATAVQEVIIALNTAASWPAESFEQAVSAAASLYVYGVQKGFSTALWLPSTGLVRDYARVLSALAAVEVSRPAQIDRSWPGFPSQAVVWLTLAGSLAPALPSSSRQVVWGAGSATAQGASLAEPTLWIDANLPLPAQFL